jgi:hypothetical protein
MKSRVFSRFDPSREGNKEFVRDLKCAMGLAEPQRKACLDALLGYVLARLPSDDESVLRDLEQATGLPRIRFVPALDVMAFFLKKLVAPETRSDKPADWAADLGSPELALLESTEEQKAFETLAEGVLGVSGKFRTEQMRRAYAYGVLPVLKSCGHTVEARAVQEESYKWGDSPDEYVPRIVDMVSVVSLHIATDSETEPDFFFQVREDQIDYLIGELLAAKKEVASFKTFLLTNKG